MMSKIYNSKYLPIVAAAIVWVVLSISCEPAYAGMGVYSEGYRMGQVTKFSVKGWATKSGEGQMLMGREGTPYAIHSTDSDGHTTKKVINPWYFSANVNKKNAINEFAGEYAWIRYEQAQIKNPLAYDTDYMVKEIAGPTRTEMTRPCNDPSASGSRSEGFRVGRIVKASSKGHLSKSFEIIIQVGNSGNQFKNMSISSPALYNCAVGVLKSGKKVKVEYVESHFHNPLGSDTSYSVKSINPLSDL